MASWIENSTISASGTYTMPHDGKVLVGADGADVTLSITLDGTAFNYPETITNGEVKGLAWEVPQGSVLTFSAASKITAYG